MSVPLDIVVITTDQHRYDSVGFNHNPHVRTPNLDALAAEGIILDHCYTTSPVCAPSRGSLWTGRYPCLHGQRSNGFTMPAGETKWWEFLRDAGYRTAGIGKMHAEPWDDRLGFDDRIIIEGKDWLMGEDEYARFLHQRGYDFSRPRQAAAVRDLHWCSPRLSPVPTEHHIDTYITDRAVEYIVSHGREAGPLALWVSLCSPHHPIDPPAEYAERYASTPVPKHVIAGDEPQSKTPEQVDNWRWDVADEEIRAQSWRYYWATVELVDDQVGRVPAAADLRNELEHRLLHRLIDATDLRHRVLVEPTNKGAYQGYLSARADQAARYMPPE